MKIDHDFTAPGDSQRPFIHPDRPAARFRPLKALHHFRELIKDKEDTEQVFHIFECLPRPGFRKDARAFVESDKGRALLVSEPELAPILDDHDRLREMPEGSLAHAYCDFMEKEGLSAAGLIAEYDRFSPRKYNDLIEWYGFRQRDTHDLLHVLTDLLAQPLAALRQRLHIRTPHFYHQAHEKFRARDIDPYDMLAQAA